jgi:hypothetical protein
MAVWEGFPPTPQDGRWRSLAQGCNVHAHCSIRVGAVAGNLIRMEKPGRRGSLYFPSFQSCTAVFVAVADSKLRVVYADAGSYGTASAACIGGTSALWHSTAAQAVTNARYTSSSALCATLQRTAQRPTSVVACPSGRKCNVRFEQRTLVVWPLQYTDSLSYNGRTVTLV